MNLRNGWILLLAASVIAHGCGHDSKSSTAGDSSKTPSGSTKGELLDEVEAQGEGQRHSGDADSHDGSEPAEIVELGTTSLGGSEIRASRDVGEIRPGGDAPIDVWIDGGKGGAAVVRFWIGTEDAKASLKARADIENDHWHTHVEVPDPIPEGSRLWVEIEDPKGLATLLSFELKN